MESMAPGPKSRCTKVAAISCQASCEASACCGSTLSLVLVRPFGATAEPPRRCHRCHARHTADDRATSCHGRKANTCRITSRARTPRLDDDGDDDDAPAPPPPPTAPTSLPMPSAALSLSTLIAASMWRSASGSAHCWAAVSNSFSVGALPSVGVAKGRSKMRRLMSGNGGAGPR